MHQEKQIQNFINKKEKTIKPLYKELCLAYFQAAITGKKQFYKKYEKLQVKLVKIYNNKKDFLKLKKWNELDVKDLILARQIRVLHQAYLSSQGNPLLIKKLIKKSTEIERIFNTFRARINNKKYTDNQILEILKKETNNKLLQQAWEASKKQGKLVEKKVIEIVKLRNKLAKQLGFKNYHEFSLIVNEQTEKEISNIFKKLENLTSNPFRKLKNEMDGELVKKYKINLKKLKPWHYEDLFFQEGPEIYKFDLDKYYKNQKLIEIARKFYKNIGLPIDSLIKKSDLYERKGKYQHAFCIDIDKEGDVRVVENIKNNEKWMDTTLHEFGHAVYAKNIPRELPYFLRDNAHIFITEAIAMLFGRNSKNLSFMKKYTKINTKEIKNLKNIDKSLRLRQLVFSRWSQVMFHFEQELYINPNRNLNKLWWKLVKKYQLLNFSRNKPDWASKIHIISSPVYYHNYLLGELLASQLNSYIVKTILKQKSIKNADYSNNKKIGSYLKENIFQPGMKYKPEELIKKATGEFLNPKYFVKQFC